ncbi:MAG: YdcF family protein [Lachnospiraceae bacterium]|nr:YdcF family protein [Lachnospiraceae bacterium]
MRKSFYRNIPSIIIFLLGISGAVWFLLPFILHGILNIGNATGLAVCSAAVIYSLFTKKIHLFLKKLRKHTAGRLVTDAAAVGAAAILLLVIAETGCMIKAACNTPAPGSTVVVLGCKVRGSKPSLILRRRLDAAYDYLMENPDSVCILSGGQGPDEIISEAECMYRYLTEKGIDPDRLYQEERSTSTRENLQFSREIIDENHLEPHIAIATSDFHEYRAGRIAESLELDYAAVPGRTPAYLFASYYVRELYGILYEWIF